ncbi:hypothetical protein IWX90DRAFT_69440 [Phyllosticta citrichinensis]|uniref:Uncharacterized protein n=1 Tax=Phyllosticta citrichinensis TaxID=1130410 RepID=A0ABR1XG97_9PEZI
MTRSAAQWQEGGEGLQGLFRHLLPQPDHHVHLASNTRLRIVTSSPPFALPCSPQTHVQEPRAGKTCEEQPRPMRRLQSPGGTARKACQDVFLRLSGETTVRDVAGGGRQRGARAAGVGWRSRGEVWSKRRDGRAGVGDAIPSGRPTISPSPRRKIRGRGQSRDSSSGSFASCSIHFDGGPKALSRRGSSGEKGQMRRPCTQRPETAI